MTYATKGSTGLTLLIIGAVFSLVGIVFEFFIPWLYDYGWYTYRDIRLLITGISSVLFLAGFVVLNKEFGERTLPTSARLCTSCGLQIPRDASFCPRCGKKFG